jgi:hypothetical protein
MTVTDTVDRMTGKPITSKLDAPLTDELRGTKAGPISGLKTFPQYAKEYPPVGPGEWQMDKSGKRFLAKSLTPEAEEFDKVRQKVMKDVAKHEHAPYFDPAARKKVDPADYPRPVKTSDVTMPKKPDTLKKYTDIATSPDAIKRLEEGYKEGSQFEGAKHWYWMKQLQDEYVKVLGPEEGKKAFEEEFARAMADTTGGADPQTNFLASHYLAMQRKQGLPAAEKSVDMPYPVGGRYMATNMEGANARGGKPFDPLVNPKRHNFEGNFLGHYDPTIDEQMMGGFDPEGPDMPAFYGPYERSISGLAAKHRLPGGSEYQDVTWAGLKRNAEKARGKAKLYDPQPMIQIVNDSIERTARLTGMTPEQVVVNNLILKKGPMYGISGLVAAEAMRRAVQGEEGEEQWR